MTPEEIQAVVMVVIELASIFGALGAVAVLAVLAIFRSFTDWMLDREERAQRISAARKRVHVQDEAKTFA